jgi:superfamily II DNA helicase RecQ
MKYQFFAIPALNPDQAQEALNRFCAAHRVVAVDKELIVDGAKSFWSICVGYQDAGAEAPAQSRKGRVDYKEVLSEEEFVVYASLRDLRKELAEAEGVPAYALFTNEQMADIVRRRVDSVSALGQIDGVGAARIEKYGEAFVKAAREGWAKMPKAAGNAPRPN